MKKYILLLLSIVILLSENAAYCSTMGRYYNTAPSLSAEQISKTSQKIKKDVSEYNSQLYNDYQKNFTQKQQRNRNYYEQNQYNNEYERNERNNQNQRNKQLPQDTDPNWWRWENDYNQWKFDYKTY